MEAFTRAYERVLFEVCKSREFEAGYDKIAIYTDTDGIVTHAARWWVEDDGWSSKLGAENDICHHSLEAIEGEGAAPSLSQFFSGGRVKLFESIEV